MSIPAYGMDSSTEQQAISVPNLRLDTAVLNRSCGVPPEGAHHTKGFSYRDAYN
ncbi:hypothetical protein [Prochlorothrix hollandica]|uniref:hypothetical protein n=1 Tax=Prochlorothrix hollandica TaxID=1223 RepID=UPI001CED2551|nr:hypothetical protein [Prochlorothrix hollandica]